MGPRCDKEPLEGRRVRGRRKQVEQAAPIVVDDNQNDIARVAAGQSGDIVEEREIAAETESATMNPCDSQRRRSETVDTRRSPIGEDAAPFHGVRIHVSNRHR